MKSADELCRELFQRGWIARPDPRISPLSGGVSSDILLLDDDRRQVVLKRALPKLRVADDWQADTSRNFYEQEYLQYVGRLLPGSVPRVLERDAAEGFFIMEYLGGDFENWKTLLLAGKASSAHAIAAGQMLGTIHRASWNDESVRKKFATTPNFFQLRIDPYLITTGRRHPALQPIFQREAERLAETSLALVHGDFSPKNMLIGSNRMVLLDCEVAWFGDPAFDVAFLLNHFLLKALVHRDEPAPYLELAERAWTTYWKTLEMRDDALEERVTRLLLMLLLARIDGKSPVEYLTGDEPKQTVREFVTDRLPKADWKLQPTFDAWKQRLVP